VLEMYPGPKELQLYMKYFLLISWWQIYFSKFLEFHGSSFHGYIFHHMFFQGYMCKL
jgi:hypothetical protein